MATMYSLVLVQLMISVISGLPCDPPLAGCCQCDSNGVCVQACSTACLNCTENVDVCTECELGYLMVSDFVSVACTACTDENCITCDPEPDICITCACGYAPNAEGQCIAEVSNGPCNPPIPGCNTCDAQGACITECLPGCLDCSEGLDICTECQFGYLMVDHISPSSCHECVDQHCLKCELEPDNCVSCASGYSVDTTGKCVITAGCEVTQRPIKQYHDKFRGLSIFVDFNVQCAGMLSGVEFFAESIGSFYFSIWRPAPCGNSWILIGFVEITAEKKGSQTYTIPASEQIDVEARDVMGTFYANGRRPIIVSSKNIRKKLQDDTSSRIIHTKETLDDLSLGDMRSTIINKGDTQRIIPINAIIS